MAALSITAANVLGTGNQKDGIAGATITAGQALYMGPSNTLLVAVNDTAAHAEAVGIALHGASSGQPLKYQLGGLINLGATVAVGMPYALGTAGGIIPVSDIAAGVFTSILGVGITASSFKVGINNSGVAAAADVT